MFWLHQWPCCQQHFHIRGSNRVIMNSQIRQICAQLYQLECTLHPCDSVWWPILVTIACPLTSGILTCFLSVLSRLWQILYNMDIQISMRFIDGNVQVMSLPKLNDEEKLNRWSQHKKDVLKMHTLKRLKTFRWRFFQQVSVFCSYWFFADIEKTLSEDQEKEKPRISVIYLFRENVY